MSSSPQTGIDCGCGCGVQARGDGRWEMGDPFLLSNVASGWLFG